MALRPQETETVRAFRRNAAQVRTALTALHDAQQEEARKGLRVVDGYIESEEWLQRYRRLSTPVRRAAIDTDKASLRRTIRALAEDSDARVTEPLAAARKAFDQVQAELDATVGLGGRRVARGELFRAWMDAAVFYDSTDKQRPYEALVAAHGKAIESMAAQLTEDFAAAVLAVDEAAALALDEPLILPPPPRTPPPPPDPKEKGWWWKGIRSVLRRKTED